MNDFRVDLARFNSEDVMTKAAVRWIEADTLAEAKEEALAMVRGSSSWVVIDVSEVSEAEAEAGVARQTTGRII